MSRVPLRLRLTAAFAVGMGAVLTVAGVLLYQHVTRTLDRTLDDGLQARAADVAALVAQADTGLAESRVRVGTDTGFAQVLDARGRSIDQTPGLAPTALLRPDQLERARHGALLIDRTNFAGELVRLRAEPVAAQGQQLVVVVGAPLETRDHALATLRTALIVGLPVALALASLLGYLLAAAALRPVERMRARAASISATRLSERLPVACSNDEVSRLGKTLNEMLARLEQGLERERSFVADASHELRTPLAHLRAEVELALEGPRGRDELEAALRSVGAETDRLSQLAADLLLLARLDKGTLPIRRDEVDLADVLEGVATRFRRRAAEGGRTIETVAGGEAHVDRLRIEQALGNLIENSLRHGAGTIRLSAVERDGAIEFEVSDEGPGFSPEFVPNAFERFSRAEQSRGSGGAGLGLAIVAAVASAHAGTARIAERPGGATVSLRIPF
jgi:heavy metal sensor kinase